MNDDRERDDPDEDEDEDDPVVGEWQHRVGRLAGACRWEQAGEGDRQGVF